MVCSSAAHSWLCRVIKSKFRVNYVEISKSYVVISSYYVEISS